MANRIYRSLDEAQPYIRLFHLSPAASPQSPLIGHLQPVLLDSVPPYEALSYAWGTPDPADSVLVDDCDIPITANLAAALRGLRLTNDVRVLWIDAICINQHSSAERAHQVTLMGQIYSRCHRDILWLGPSPGTISEYRLPTVENLVKGLQLMKGMADRDIGMLEPMFQKWRGYESTPRGWGDWIPDEYTQQHEREEAKEAREPEDGQRMAFLRSDEQEQLSGAFRDAPVWKRLWVMQELSLAPNILLVAGNYSLEWDYITRFLGDAPYADAFHGTFGHGIVAPVGKGIFAKVQEVDHQRRIMRDASAGKGDSKLLDVLARFRSCISSDPRDKVFGLLSLTTEDIRIEVGYLRSPQQVYADVTVSLINYMRNLDMICQSPWKNGRFNRPDDAWWRGLYQDKHLEHLPSWAADFQYSDDISLFAQRFIFNAGKPSCDVPCEVHDGRALRTRGVILGRIGPILQPDFDTTDWKARNERRKSRSKLPINWMKMYMERGIKPRPPMEKSYITGECALTAFWRTLVADCEGYPMKRLSAERIKEEDEHVRSEWSGETGFKEVADQDSLEREDFFSYKGITRIWDDLLSKWTFSMTTNGLYVLLKPPAREGDIIACLDGAKLPIVLRHVPKDGLPNCYEVVTTAYVHGFMDMEATESGQLRRTLGLEDQELWLV